MEFWEGLWGEIEERVEFESTGKGKVRVKGARLKSLCGNSKFMASAAEQFAEKGLQPFPQGLKPIASQELIVGAKAPTP